MESPHLLLSSCSKLIFLGFGFHNYKRGDKAGAYAIQEHSELILARLDGSLSNVIGLPAERLTAELEQLFPAGH